MQEGEMLIWNYLNDYLIYWRRTGSEAFFAHINKRIAEVYFS
jgi:hypothetical protein